MLLAGILLKFGRFGLYRITFINVSCIYSYLLIGLSLATVACLYESDVKRVIAYSSVVHIIIVPFIIIIDNPLSSKIIILVSIYHAFSRALLFLIVGLINEFYSSRSIYLLRGGLQTSLIFILIVIIGIIINISMPPFINFFMEIYFIAEIVNYNTVSIPFLGVIIVGGLIYSLN
jgi:NADH:ubiquinone oxidoreductase subunit 4 (subunit M)